jgi:(p)ppGpp synthase/HD superfamily hydrolase
MQSDWIKELAGMTLAPYIGKARALIGVPRISGGNMFRHQMMTLTILLDYLVIDPVLLKTSIIHDIAEDALYMPGLSRDDIAGIDSDGEQVYELVLEITRRFDAQGKKEPKSQFLRRIMETGSRRAKILKLADRISNLISLGYVHDRAFVEKTLAETRDYILPYSNAINPDMDRELRDLVLSRERNLRLLEHNS